MIGLATAVSVVMAVAVVSSCRRASDNGKIDGYWKIQEIYYIADGTTVYPEEEFIGIQLELIQLMNPRPVGSSKGWLTGVVSYDKKSDFFSVDFRYNPSPEQLYPYGFSAPQEVLAIERADSRYLVFTSAIARVTCRKF